MSASTDRFRALFEPRGVLVAGASTHPGKFGFVSLHNILAAGYEGKVFGTNRDGAEVLGVQTVADVAELPDGEIDLVFVCTPAAANPDLLRACAKKGITAAFIASAGYGEAGEEGRRAQADLVALADELGILLAGPNGQGVVSPPAKLCAQIVAPYPPAGHIAIAAAINHHIRQNRLPARFVLDDHTRDAITLAHATAFGGRVREDANDHDLVVTLLDAHPEATVATAGARRELLDLLGRKELGVRVVQLANQPTCCLLIHRPRGERIDEPVGDERHDRRRRERRTTRQPSRRLPHLPRRPHPPRRNRADDSHEYACTKQNHESDNSPEHVAASGAAAHRERPRRARRARRVAAATA